MDKELKEELFMARLDKTTKSNLERLAGQAGKSQAEIVRQLINQASTGQQPQQVRQNWQSAIVSK